MREGALEQLGTPDEIYGDPANLFVAQFVGTPPMNVVEDGGRVLGVRPEHVHLEGSRWARERGEARDGTVELVEPLGDQTHVTLATGQGRLVARAEPEFRPAPGARVRFWLDHALAFDRETGRRL
jgi:ABC-type sugar transport system ATPase subunit